VVCDAIGRRLEALAGRNVVWLRYYYRKSRLDYL